MWDPWVALVQRPGITLRFDRLNWPTVGHSGGRHGEWHVTLDVRLNRAGRRCTLAHELVHIERGIIAAPPGIMEREEHLVRVETARRLVPMPDLARTVAHMETIGVGVEAHHVSSFYDVTDAVAVDALSLLRRESRARP